MTPYECELLIAIHTRPNIDDAVADSDLRKETIRVWKNWKLVEVDPFSKTGEARLCLTVYGRAWLGSILNTPYPTIKYYDKHGDPIKPI